MKKEPFLVVYIVEKDFCFEESFFPEWRKKEIEESTVCRRDKIAVWHALNFAVKDYLGSNLKDLNPRKTKSEKPVIDGYFISLSHTRHYTLVTLSNYEVGGDILYVCELNDNYLSQAKIWSKAERKRLNENKDNMFLKFDYFSKKEALYKFLDPKVPFDEDSRSGFDTVLFEPFFFTSDVNAKHAYFSICSALIKEGYEPEIRYIKAPN